MDIKNILKERAQRLNQLREKEEKDKQTIERRTQQENRKEKRLNEIRENKEKQINRKEEVSFEFLKIIEKNEPSWAEQIRTRSEIILNDVLQYGDDEEFGELLEMTFFKQAICDSEVLKRSIPQIIETKNPKMMKHIMKDKDLVSKLYLMKTEMNISFGEKIDQITAEHNNANKTSNELEGDISKYLNTDLLFELYAYLYPNPKTFILSDIQDDPPPPYTEETD